MDEMGDDVKHDAHFDFAESKKLIYYKDKSGQDQVFLPGYSLTVNQQTGLYQGNSDLKEYIREPKIQGAPFDHANVQTAKEKIAPAPIPAR